MANIKRKKGVIGILTGGGDVPGLNPAIRAITIRAQREGYNVIEPDQSIESAIRRLNRKYLRRNG